MSRQTTQVTGFGRNAEEVARDMISEAGVFGGKKIAPDPASLELHPIEPGTALYEKYGAGYFWAHYTDTGTEC